MTLTSDLNFAPLVTLVQRCGSTKLEVQGFPISRKSEARDGSTDGQTDGRVQSVLSHRDGRIIKNASYSYRWLILTES